MAGAVPRDRLAPDDPRALHAEPVSDLSIRDYRDGDAPILSNLYRRSVEGLGARAYSPEQIAVWAGLAPSADRLTTLMADGRRRRVAELGGEIAGFADIEADGHVHFLYADPQTGRGVGSALLRDAEAIARTTGATRLHAEASEVARPVFEKAGYRVVERRDFEVDGVAIHNWAVEKAL